MILYVPKYSNSTSFVILFLSVNLTTSCSPVGMKKLFKTYVDESALEKDFIYVSGGKIGMQIKINPRDLEKLIGAEFVQIVRRD